VAARRDPYRAAAGSTTRSPKDLDLFTARRLAGWKVRLPRGRRLAAELPEDVSAFRAQQFRWAKGTVQDGAASFWSGS